MLSQGASPGVKFLLSVFIRCGKNSSSADNLSVLCTPRTAAIQGMGSSFQCHNIHCTPPPCVSMADTKSATTWTNPTGTDQRFSVCRSLWWFIAHVCSWELNIDDVKHSYQKVQRPVVWMQTLTALVQARAEGVDVRAVRDGDCAICCH